MSDDTAAIILQLVQETRDDVKDLRTDVARLDERMKALESRDAAPQLSLAKHGGLAAGGGALVVAIVQILQAVGVVK